ncbi:Hydroxyacid oxidase 1, variant 2 [Entomophthora muscae]|uniref:Hydroxyacid oxidase 1, variant 2 n=1 Tax=Entomophthora muscae TaxID=34485 RepID=A0ACC2TBL1_9FUNG|nr:Hydroxyacid oxidase 1, variant 2 [Entomophthora muscae]
MSDNCVCLADFEEQCEKILDKNAWDYYRSGADSEVTLRRNRTSFSKYLLRPRMLQGVGMVSLKTTLLGHTVASPVGMAPVGYQALAHPDGELATVRVNRKRNGCMILSTMSNHSLEDVMQENQSCESLPNETSPGEVRTAPLLWFQLYVCKEPSFTEQLLERAYYSGYKAVVVTIDTPMIGKRRDDIRNSFKLPRHLRIANLDSLDFSKFGLDKNVVNAHKVPTDGGSSLELVSSKILNEDLTWDDIAWLKAASKLPIILKGVLTAEDAKLAVKSGASAIIVSNHGGRQLDYAPATIEVLSEIVSAVNGEIEVYLDGGIREGTDVIKALAIGAKAVFVGRPIVWGLSCEGEKGLSKVFEILDAELKLSLALCGVKDVNELNRSHIANIGCDCDSKLSNKL